MGVSAQLEQGGGGAHAASLRQAEGGRLPVLFCFFLQPRTFLALTEQAVHQVYFDLKSPESQKWLTNHYPGNHYRSRLRLLFFCALLRYSAPGPAYSG